MSTLRDKGQLCVCGGLMLVVIVLLGGCAGGERLEGVRGWIAAQAVPVRELREQSRGARDLRRAFDGARVMALGEATHGQHESFEIKRAITMHLIREHGYRIVAYEASASKAALCDAYVSGASDDLNEAMRGFGMLIWDVEENAALLRELRAWNQSASAEQRVRFVGVDVQDVGACVKRLSGLLGERWGSEAGAAVSIRERLDGATQKMFGGDRAEYDELVREAMELVERVQAATSGEARDSELMVELRSALREFEGGVQMYLTPGRRDRAMGEMALGVLEDAGERAKMVLWAHNGHVTKSPLRYLGSEELGAGGHMAQALGERYYAVGFAFGEGEFVANDKSDTEGGKWGFRTYAVDAAPAGSLESWFASSVREPVVIDLRSDTGDAAVEEWKRAGHGQRWFGGYKVPRDVREMTRDVTNLLATYPREGFDALVYMPRTTGSVARDKSRVLEAAQDAR